MIQIICAFIAGAAWIAIALWGPASYMRGTLIVVTVFYIIAACTSRACAFGLSPMAEAGTELGTSIGMGIAFAWLLFATTTRYRRPVLAALAMALCLTVAGSAHASGWKGEGADGFTLLTVGIVLVLIAAALAPGFMLKLLGATVLFVMLCVVLANANAGEVHGADLQGNMRVLLTDDRCDGPTTSMQFIIIDLDSRIVSSGCWSPSGQYVVARDMRTMQPFRWPKSAFVLLRGVR